MAKVNDIQKAAAEITAPKRPFLKRIFGAKEAPTVRGFMTEGFEFLDEISEGKFKVVEKKSLDARDAALFVTNIVTGDGPGGARKLRVAIDTQDNLFVNVNNPSKLPDRMPEVYVPSLADEEKASLAADADAAGYANQAVTDEGYWPHAFHAARPEAYNDYMESLKLRDGYTLDIIPTSTATTPALALANMARLAVMQELVLAMPAAPKHPTAAQQAVFDGLEKGFQWRTRELIMVENIIALPFSSGLEFLRKMSGDTINIEPKRLPHGNGIIICISASAAAAGEKYFERYIKIGTNRKARIDSDGRNYDPREYNAVAEKDINELLSEVARSAVAAGKIRSGAGHVPADEHQQAVHEAVQIAEMERDFEAPKAPARAARRTASPKQLRGI